MGVACDHQLYFSSLSFAPGNRATYVGSNVDLISSGVPFFTNVTPRHEVHSETPPSPLGSIQQLS